MSETTNNSGKQYLDWEGLQKYDELIKGHINNAISPVSENAETAVNFITAFCDSVSQENPVPTLQAIANHIGTGEALHVTKTDKDKWDEAAADITGFQDTVTQLTTNVTTLTEGLEDHTADTNIHVTKDEKEAWTNAATNITTFLEAADNADKAIDTLKEIQEYITGDIEEFADLGSRVAAIEADYVKASNVIPIASIQGLFDSPATTA